MKQKTRNLSTLQILFIVFLIIYVIISTAEGDEGPYKTFMVPLSAKRKKATVAQDNVKCVLRFSTVDCKSLQQELLKKKKQKEDDEEKAKKRKEEDEKAKQENKGKSGEHFMQKISGECFSKAKGYWTYKACVGGDVVQFHGSESYSLGTFESNSQKSDEKDSNFINYESYYKNGAECMANGQKIRREAVVQFFCGDSNEIVAITETVTCKYHIVLTSVHLCGKNSPFSKYQHSASIDLSNPALSNPQSQEHTHLDLDPWVLQIEKVIVPSSEKFDSKYICSAKMVNRDLNPVPRVCFSEFALEWLPIATPDKETRNFDLMSLTVKGDKGNDVDYVNEISVSQNGVRNGDNFQNHLEFVQIGLEISKKAE